MDEYNDGSGNIKVHNDVSTISNNFVDVDDYNKHKEEFDNYKSLTEYNIDFLRQEYKSMDALQRESLKYTEEKLNKRINSISEKCNILERIIIFLVIYCVIDIISLLIYIYK